MMIRALANECDAIVLDISPMNLEGNFLKLIKSKANIWIVLEQIKCYIWSLHVQKSFNLLLLL